MCVFLTCRNKEGVRSWFHDLRKAWQSTCLENRPLLCRPWNWSEKWSWRGRAIHEGWECCRVKGEEETWGDQTHCEALQTLRCCMSGPVHVTGGTSDGCKSSRSRPGSVCCGVCARRSSSRVPGLSTACSIASEHV